MDLLTQEAPSSRVHFFEITKQIESETSSLSGFAPILFKATPAEKYAFTVVRRGRWEGSGRAVHF